MEISFKDSVASCGMPVVYTDDRRLCFLVDTGASYCVLLREAYERERGCFGKDEGRNYLIGMEGNPCSVFTVRGTVRIGGAERTAEFSVLDSVQAMDTIRILTGTRIDGALGVDFLRRYGVSVDFSRLSLTDNKN